MSRKIKTIIRHIIAVLAFPRKINDFLTYAKGIYKAMTGSTYFPNSESKLATLNTDITSLDTIESNLKMNPPKNTVEDRDAAWEIVRNDLRALVKDVQTAADAVPAKAEVIIKAASLKAKSQTIRQKRTNNVKDGNVSGTVVLEAEGAGAHEWQMSKDKTAITNLDATSTSSTTVTGLTPGDMWFFRNRSILRKGGKGDWSDWMEIRV